MATGAPLSTAGVGMAVGTGGVAVRVGASVGVLDGLGGVAEGVW